MSASTIDQPVRPAVADPSVAPVPFGRLLQVELRKTYDTRAGFWLLVAIGVLTAAVITILLFTAGTEDLTHKRFLLVSLTPQGALLPVMAILAVTAEWSQRTGLVTFTLEPSRLRVIAAKLVAVTLLGLLAVVLALGLAAVGNLLGMSLQDGAGDWDVTGAYLRDFTVLQVLGLAQGFAFGLILLNPAAAIVAYFLLPTLWSILFTLVDWLSDIAPWVDMATAADAILQGDSLDGEAWAHVAVSSTIWVVLPLLLGLWRLTRAEVKSA